MKLDKGKKVTTSFSCSVNNLNATSWSAEDPSNKLSTLSNRSIASFEKLKYILKIGLSESFININLNYT